MGKSIIDFKNLQSFFISYLPKKVKECLDNEKDLDNDAYSELIKIVKDGANMGNIAMDHLLSAVDFLYNFICRKWGTDEIKYTYPMLVKTFLLLYITDNVHEGSNISYIEFPKENIPQPIRESDNVSEIEKKLLHGFIYRKITTQELIEKQKNMLKEFGKDPKLLDGIISILLKQDLIKKVEEYDLSNTPFKNLDGYVPLGVKQIWAKAYGGIKVSYKSVLYEVEEPLELVRKILPLLSSKELVNLRNAWMQQLDRLIPSLQNLKFDEEIIKSVKEYSSKCGFKYSYFVYVVLKRLGIDLGEYGDKK